MDARATRNRETKNRGSSAAPGFQKVLRQPSGLGSTVKQTLRKASGRRFDFISRRLASPLNDKRKASAKNSQAGNRIRHGRDADRTRQARRLSHRELRVAPPLPLRLRSPAR